jgi:hypothetical protein
MHSPSRNTEAGILTRHEQCPGLSTDVHPLPLTRGSRHYPPEYDERTFQEGEFALMALKHRSPIQEGYFSSFLRLQSRVEEELRQECPKTWVQGIVE